MWKHILGCSRTVLRISNNKKIYRTFLSDVYKCPDSWSLRLTTPVLQNVKLDDLYYDLDQEFQPNGMGTAVDVDIFANCVVDANHIDELIDLLYKLRLSAETSNTLDSTSHAVIRILNDLKMKEQLFTVLNDRLNYGIFLDHFSANMLMDSFIKTKDFKSASEVACLLMLQEDFTNEINASLSLYSCYMYLQNPVPIEPIQIEEQPTDKKKKKVEETKVRVKFLRNPYLDNHFDIRDTNHLIGKTLHMIGATMNNKIGNSAKLVGLIMYQKYEKASQLLKSFGNDSVHTEAIDIANKTLNAVETTDENKVYMEQIKICLGELKGTQGLEKDIEDLVKTTVKLHEQREIEDLKKTYQQWIQDRQIALDEHTARKDKEKRLADVESKLKELEEEERKLWFFEREEQMDLDIEKKKIYYPKRFFGKKKKPRIIDEDYVPPEVTSRRN